MTVIIFLGYGRFNENRLWAGSVPDQIAEMKKNLEEVSKRREAGMAFLG